MAEKDKQDNHRMEHKCDLKTATVVWWRFFWRYAVIFVAAILFVGICVNFYGDIQSRRLYMITLLSGIFANIVAAFSAMSYCLDRKFKKSPLVLKGKNEKTGFVDRLWIWLLYFLRFALLAILSMSITIGKTILVLLNGFRSN